MAKNFYGRGRLAYMVLDTETATLPFADEIAQGDINKKKKIAIARPLIYDIGYTICFRDGTIIEKKAFLVSEIFSVPSIFNTAYYAGKRPLYIEMLRREEITVLPWNDIMKIFLQDLAKVDAVGAFNAMFDFKKAIPFTELYIKQLYGNGFYEWMEIQQKLCEKIAMTPYRKDPNKEDFRPDVFEFREEEYVLFDLWGLATKRLINNSAYKRDCLTYNLISESGEYFKTSAEAVFQYICKEYNFVEDHTALSDAEIETFILGKVLSRGKMEIGITSFPFKELGTTIDFLLSLPNPKREHIQMIATAIENKLNEYDALNKAAIQQRSKYERYIGILHQLHEQKGRE